MSANPRATYVDALSMSEQDAYVYEVIATLEYTGKAATRADIFAMADLEDRVLDAALRRLTESGLLVRADVAGQPGYEPATRDWSAAPSQE